MRGKLEANFSHLRPYSRVIVLNMAATRKQWSTFKPRKQLCHRSERQKEKNASAQVNKLSCGAHS